MQKKLILKIVMLLLGVMPFFSVGVWDFWKVNLLGTVSQGNVIDVKYNYKNYKGVGRSCSSNLHRDRTGRLRRGYTYFVEDSKTNKKYEFCTSILMDSLYGIKKNISIPIKIYGSEMIPWNEGTNIMFALWQVFILFWFWFLIVFPYTSDLSLNRYREKISGISLKEFVERNG